MTEGQIRIVEEDGGAVLYLDFGEHKPIAKRYSGGSWIVLVPGFKVIGGEPGCYDTISVERHSDQAAPQ
jgi:hypothetical protein